jgi:DsbC/DsbD-like thiol-disulfide interchange protein
MHLPITFLFALLAATPAFAGATAWQELGLDARVRLITSDKLNPDGTTLGAIELDMPQGMKTYWRVPGETGIATELDLTGSAGIAGHRFFWPYPQVEQKGGYTDFVYYGPLVIPLELTLDGTSAQLEAALLMGICSDVCIPATASFSLPLDFSVPDAGQDIRIQQALAQTPLGWTGPGEPVGETRFDPAEGLLWVVIDPAEVDPGSILADAGAAGYLFGAPKKSREPGLVSLPLLGGGDAAGLAGASVRLLFMTRDGPYEVERRIQSMVPAGQ